MSSRHEQGAIYLCKWLAHSTLTKRLVGCQPFRQVHHGNHSAGRPIPSDRPRASSGQSRVMAQSQSDGRRSNSRERAMTNCTSGQEEEDWLVYGAGECSLSSRLLVGATLLSCSRLRESRSRNRLDDHTRSINFICIVKLVLLDLNGNTTIHFLVAQCCFAPLRSDD